MENSPSESKIFSVRIVSIDYHMSPPIAGFDICYSSFQGGNVNEVPVIRVYGSTPAGQKTCMHVHRALPYLYVPCSDVLVHSHNEGEAYTHTICLDLETALKLKGNAGSKRQHVHGCDVVRAKRFYGYHSSEELFFKIYLYYPQDVSRAANLLLVGAVLGRCLQPHESHIPFLLQFMVDYNLYGMGHLHLSRLKFRNPVPDVLSPAKIIWNGQYGEEICKWASISGFQEGSGAAACSGSQVWISSTIPGDWLWQISSEFCATSQEDAQHVKRQSICGLEGDTTIDDILNQQFKTYTSLSQTSSEVKMVQSLIPIWEEEYERTGMKGVAMPLEPDKPLPEDVLKTLLVGLEFENKLLELCREAEDQATSAQNDPKLVQSLISSADESLVELGPGEDIEALGLLRWLATSQAAEDIHSDDELACEAILSPLLPAESIEKVLKKASNDYENESQRECLDILDSVEDLLGLESLKERRAQYGDCSRCPQTSSETKIPQVDGSNDELCFTHCKSNEKASKIEPKSESKRSFGQRVVQDAGISFTSMHKRSRSSWGSFPFSTSEKVKDEIGAASFNNPNPGVDESKDAVLTSVSPGNKLVRFSSSLTESTETRVWNTKESSALAGCSVRELMRKKRRYRVEHPDFGSVSAEKVFLQGEQNEDTHLFAKEDNDKHAESSHVFPNLGLWASCEMDFHEAGASTTAGLSFPSLGTRKRELPWPFILKKQDSAVSICQFEPCRDKESESGSNSTKAINSDAYISKSSIDVLLNLDSEGKSSADERVQQTAGSSFLPASPVVCDMLSTNDDIRGAGCKIFIELEHEVSNKNFMGMDATTGITHVQNEKNDGENVGDANLSGKGLSTPTVVNMEAKPVDLITMAFCRKPPDADFNHRESENALYLPDRALYEIPRFFDVDCSEEIDQECFKSSYSCQETIMGVPTHCQNDGSYLYLLTPVLPPPSADSVCSWVLHDGEGISGETNAGLVEDLSPKGFSHGLTDSQSSSPDDCNKALAETDSRSLMVPTAEQKDKRNGVPAEVDPYHNEVTTTLQAKGNFAKANACNESSQDVSQISGPDGRSGPTPLSQIGFRDPASVGAGQQLTLLSVEVQAESRGDLRPDPRFDAINIVALVIHNDSHPVFDVIVLLRSNVESCLRNVDGIPGCKVFIFFDEKLLFSQFVKVLSLVDPDILLGWDIQGGSLGFMAERAAHLGIGLLNNISRTPCETKMAAEMRMPASMLSESLIGESVVAEDAIIEDEWGRTHASGVHVGGRVVLNVWRLMRGEVKLNTYTVEAVAEAVLRRRIPSIPYKVLTKWFSSGPGRVRYRCIEYVIGRAKLNLEIMNQLDMINRTSELARVFGIDFFSVLSRGSQYRVESMLLRLAHTQNYLAISPGNQQVASQPAMECLPLVMEPESGFYGDPVVVLDFQSLYPSMIIAYNLCFCTCLGKIAPLKAKSLGVSSFCPDPQVVRDLKDQMLLTPNGVMYVPSKVRKGILPRLLEEILSTRIMVKQAMKKLAPSQQVLQRIFNARQLALKLIANVTYGYTAAGFSGRMPCAELADSIVQCGRSTLEMAISFVNANDKWKAKVIYGDTDSMFVLLKGRSVKEAFQIGHEIASTITAMNPNPVTLKMEKVYHPCFLLTKKRYVGYSYESPDQVKPLFDAKGIETVRRDTCGAVVKAMEQSLRLFFEHQEISQVRAFLCRQWTRILSGRVSLQDFIFAKEVRLGTYSTRSSSSLPPAAIVATKAMRADPRAEPRYAERVPYVVIHGEPGARLVDMVVDPLDLLVIDSPYRLNDLYYINKQIIPALQRVFGLVGADLNQWFSEMPRPVREAFTKRPLCASNPQRTRIDYYYLSRHCMLCGELVQASTYLCSECLQKESIAAAAVIGRTSKLEREIQHLAAICRHCGGGDWIVESGVKCTSLACSVFYERVKVQKELQGLSVVAAANGLYPKCMVEWF